MHFLFSTISGFIESIWRRWYGGWIEGTMEDKLPKWLYRFLSSRGTQTIFNLIVLFGIFMLNPIWTTTPLSSWLISHGIYDWCIASIMSIITGMGGNAGTQTISIIIRNIAMGKVSLKDSWHLLGKEILLGVIDGAVIGIVTSGIVSIMYGNYYLGIIAFLAMVANLIISGVSGILIPLILQKLKIDPALSSSIFLTTATDVLGFFIFLSLAKIFLVHLM